MRTIKVLVHGFKVIAAYDLLTQIPVGIVVSKIECHESRWTKRLIKQIRENFADSPCCIIQILMDRGFLDGETEFSILGGLRIRTSPRVWEAETRSFLAMGWTLREWLPSHVHP